MMKDMMKLMDKKGGQEMSEQEVQAKMDVVQELLQMAQEAMGSRVKHDMDEMQKVSVAAPDKESLLEGLEMAQDVAEESPEMEESSEEKSPESEEVVEAAPAVEAEEEEVSPFMKKKSAAPAKKKLFSMED